MARGKGTRSVHSSVSERLSSCTLTDSPSVCNHSSHPLFSRQMYIFLCPHSICKTAVCHSSSSLDQFQKAQARLWRWKTAALCTLGRFNLLVRIFSVLLRDGRNLLSQCASMFRWVILYSHSYRAICWTRIDLCWTTEWSQIPVNSSRSYPRNIQNCVTKKSCVIRTANFSCKGKIMPERVFPTDRMYCATTKIWSWWSTLFTNGVGPVVCMEGQKWNE